MNLLVKLGYNFSVKCFKKNENKQNRDRGSGWPVKTCFRHDHGHVLKFQKIAKIKLHIKLTEIWAAVDAYLFDQCICGV